MNQYAKIDADGLFSGDALLSNPPLLESGEPDPSYISVPCPNGFYWPRWDGEKWVEGGTAPEPVQQPPTQEERLEALEAAMLEIIIGGV